MPREYWSAPEVEATGQKHSNPAMACKELAQFSIAYLFTGEMLSKGKSTSWPRSRK